MNKHVGLKDYGALKITLSAVFFCVVMFLYSVFTYAQEYRFLQGVISLEGVNYLIVNENERVNLLEETIIKNNKGHVIPLSTLKVGKWVYIEGPLNIDGNIDAEVIYLLPGRIPKNERFKYPFMQLPI